MENFNKIYENLLLFNYELLFGVKLLNLLSALFIILIFITLKKIIKNLLLKNFCLLIKFSNEESKKNFTDSLYKPTEFFVFSLGFFIICHIKILIHFFLKSQQIF